MPNYRTFLHCLDTTYLLLSNHTAAQSNPIQISFIKKLPYASLQPLSYFPVDIMIKNLAHGLDIESDAIL